MIVSGGENIGDFMKLLGSGREFGAKFTYRVQDGSGGIPVALGLAREFVGDDKCVVVLGDNVMENDIKDAVKEFSKSEIGARVFLRKVHDPKRYGIAEVKNKKVIACYEKPENPVSDLAILGVYMFDKHVFDIIPKLKPSRRDELEIVDVLNDYIKRHSLTYSILDGFWIDAGTFDALYKANTFIAGLEKPR